MEVHPAASLANISQVPRPVVVHGVPLAKSVKEEDAGPWVAVALDIVANPMWLLDGDGGRRGYALDVLDRLEWLEGRFARGLTNPTRHGRAESVGSAAHRLHKQLLRPVLPTDDEAAFEHAAVVRDRHLADVLDRRLLQTQAQQMQVLEAVERVLGRVKLVERRLREQQDRQRPRRKKDPKAPTLVYFVLWNPAGRKNTRWLKIGATDNGPTPADRVAQHTKVRRAVFADKSDCKVELLGWTTGYENEWHQRYGDFLVADRKEEFYVGGPVKAFVDRLLRRDRTLAGEGILLPPPGENPSPGR